MPLILEKHLVVLEYLPTSLKILEYLLKCSFFIFNVEEARVNNMKKTEQCVESFHLEQLCGNQGRIK